MSNPLEEAGLTEKDAQRWLENLAPKDLAKGQWVTRAVATESYLAGALAAQAKLAWAIAEDLIAEGSVCQLYGYQLKDWLRDLGWHQST